MKTFGIRGKLWRYPGVGAWHFVYVSKEISQKIRDTKQMKKGSSFVRVRATVGKTSWVTTLFPSKDGPYLLAIKADVRAKENIAEGDQVAVSCTLL